MNKREITLETNKFPTKFSGEFIYDQKAKGFFNKIEIDLDELCAKFFIEEFNDHAIKIHHYGQYPALNYLIENVKEFKFQGAHPGAGKDSRIDNSRVLGQTICRYLIEKTFTSPYIANISTLLGRKLPADFSHISIDRVQPGDTPDFLFMDNNNEPCLAEAKGRRTAVLFSDDKFESWRQQLERVEVKVNGKTQEVKGYITELAIANEENSMTNSIIFMEDPVRDGVQYSEGNLDQLIKLAHYERILSKSYLNFIGNSLLSDLRLPKEKNYVVEVFRIDGFDSISNQEIVPLINNRLHPIYRQSNFIGINLNILKILLSISRGEQQEINKDLNYEVFNSVFFRFGDGITVCNSNLLNFVGMREI